MLETTTVGFNQVKPTKNGEKVQTRVLTDYLRNLHYKYKCENPSVEISLSTFGRLRPKYVLKKHMPMYSPSKYGFKSTSAQKMWS